MAVSKVQQIHAGVTEIIPDISEDTELAKAVAKPTGEPPTLLASETLSAAAKFRGVAKPLGIQTKDLAAYNALIAGAKTRIDSYTLVIPPNGVCPISKVLDLTSGNKVLFDTNGLSTLYTGNLSNIELLGYGIPTTQLELATHEFDPDLVPLTKPAPKTAQL
jgi:hypothetical protein